MITINLSGSYEKAAFFDTIYTAISAPAHAGHNLDALVDVLTGDTPDEITLIWNKFHDCTVGTYDSEEVASALRDAAHQNTNIRLIFYDEEQGGQ